MRYKDRQSQPTYGMSIRFDCELSDALKKASFQTGKSKMEIIRTALREHLKLGFTSNNNPPM